MLDERSKKERSLLRNLKHLHKLPFQEAILPLRSRKHNEEESCKSHQLHLLFLGYWKIKSLSESLCKL